MSSGIKALLVAASASTTGGGEKHVADLMPRLLDAGIDLSIVCPPQGDLPALAADLGVTVHDVDLSRGICDRHVLAVRQAIRAAVPDIVHAHGSRAAFFARLADAHARQRVVYTVHGIHIDKAGSRLRQRVLLAAERRLRPRTARFIAVCASDREKGAALGILDPERTTVVHNGIEPSEPAVPGSFRTELDIGDAPLVLSVGRFHEQKDQRTLLAAWGLVAKEHPTAVLAIVGSGGLESGLREQRHALGLTESVRFVPPRPGLADAYTDADLFALSSLWEGFPYVIVEAMARGLPVVSTDVDGVPEAVDDGRTGLLAPASDPQALGRAIADLLSDPDRRVVMGMAGRERARSEFTLDRMVQGTLAVYRDVAGA